VKMPGRISCIEFSPHHDSGARSSSIVSDAGLPDQRPTEVKAGARSRARDRGRTPRRDVCNPGALQ
jgi:hypothetical protein